MIYYFTPYSLEKNLGIAYNRCMEIIPNDDDWGCLLDGDTMFLTPDYGVQLDEITKLAPHTGLFTCLTNRAGYKHQVFGNKMSNSADIVHHRAIAQWCRDRNRHKLRPLTTNVCGHLLLIKKSVWRAVGGFTENSIRDEGASSNLLGVDDNMSKKMRLSRRSVMCMDGVYLFHYYRLLEGEKNKSHL